ncbi:MAG: TVP38/TMEM64 family protein, partial [Planctomycetes bacterium]|nr:TVP38/TMEM64 family protein [Planctomycetota bacterium]
MTRQPQKQRSSNGSHSQPIDSATDTQSNSSNKFIKISLAGLLVILIGVAYLNRDVLSLAALAERETQLKEFQQAQPVLVIGAAFLAYVLVTGLSLPGAAFMTLLMGWYFGFTRGVVLVSFASTAGATMAFLISRYLFRDAVQAKFG